ncbi:hypothetical protein [Endozoicomonas sp. 2B-B]
MVYGIEQSQGLSEMSLGELTVSACFTQNSKRVPLTLDLSFSKLLLFINSLK